MEFDPYAIIGVSRDATQGEIKKAYRAKAQECHPDKGGDDSEEFIRLNEAYQILVDPRKRAHFDKHGHKKKSKARAEPEMEVLRDIVIEVIRTLGSKVFSVDVMWQVRSTIKQGGKEIEGDIKRIKKEIEFYRKVRSKIKGPKGSEDTIIHETLDGIVERLEISLEDRIQAKEINAQIAKVVVDYSFESNNLGRRRPKKTTLSQEEFDEIVAESRGKPDEDGATDGDFEESDDDT